MITYLWVALGGAIGSVGRAALADAMVRLVGPRFPWGTILINVLGSFAIGCFGTLTSNDSRFALPVDARVFFMVGVCGGFTTFSSFSLQTLDLARDGRPLQALGNIGLSLVLCLASVAAGHYSADLAKRGSPLQTGALSPAIIAVLDRADAAPGLLAAAERLSRLGGTSRVTAMVTGRPAVPIAVPSEEIETADRDEAASPARADARAPLRSIAAAWLPAAQGRGLTPDWAEAPAAMAGQSTRTAAAIVIQQEEHSPTLHAVLFETGRPVLVLPAGAAATFGDIVAIAWKDGEAARRAVLSALPILRHATTVHAFCAGTDVLPDFLRRHVPRAVPHRVGPEEGAADALLALCHQTGADLLVMGAYGRGEWREAIMGGVTTAMLARADVPVLMQR